MRKSPSRAQRRRGRLDAGDVDGGERVDDVEADPAVDDIEVDQIGEFGQLGGAPLVLGPAPCAFGPVATGTLPPPCFSIDSRTS